jgi:hypothetical protein
MKAISSIIGQHVELNFSRPRNWLASGCCPFHTEMTPSFTCNDQDGTFRCFGCNAEGDAAKFEALIARGFRSPPDSRPREPEPTPEEFEALQAKVAGLLNETKKIDDVAIHLPTDEHFSVGIQPNGDAVFFQTSDHGEVMMMTIRRDALADLAAFLARPVPPGD